MVVQGLERDSAFWQASTDYTGFRIKGCFIWEEGLEEEVPP